MEHIEYINKKVRGKSSTEQCKEIKITRKTVRERFLSKDIYIIKIKISTKIIKKKLAIKMKIKMKAILTLEMKLKVLETRIEALEQRIDDSLTNELYIKDFECDTVNNYFLNANLTYS